MIKSEKEPLILNRYVDLMNGLIDIADDVKVLKGQGIISKPESISDEQVAKIFREMKKSVEMTNTPDFDMAIEGVRNYYNGLWKVSVFKFMDGVEVGQSFCCSLDIVANEYPNILLGVRMSSFFLQDRQHLSGSAGLASIFVGVLICSFMSNASADVLHILSLLRIKLD